MTPARVLVVEDDRVVARDIQHQLTRIGHTVRFQKQATNRQVILVTGRFDPTRVRSLPSGELAKGRFEHGRTSEPMGVRSILWPRPFYVGAE